jgi:K+/H+ antiporter YhaU regulatory subunit KhtT
VLGLVRGGLVMPTPTGEDILQPEDVLILLGTPELQERLHRQGY